MNNDGGPACEKPCLMAAQWAFEESVRELGRAIAAELHLRELVDWLYRRWVHWRVVPHMIWARVKAARRRPVVGAIGLKVCRPGGNARDRRTQSVARQGAARLCGALRGEAVQGGEGQGYKEART